MAGDVAPHLGAVDDSRAVVDDPPGQAGLVGAHPPGEFASRARRVDRVIGGRYTYTGRVDASGDEDPARESASHDGRDRVKDAPETEVGGQGGSDCEAGRIGARVGEGRCKQGWVGGHRDGPRLDEAGGNEPRAGIPMQSRDQRRKGRGGDARTPLGAGVERGEARGQVPL